MADLNPNVLIHNPHHITQRLALGDDPLIFRLLLPGDGELLGHYFDALSAETRRRYGPHPLTMGEAQNLCARINRHDALRFVALLPAPAPKIIAYFILMLGVNEHEGERYASYGVELDRGLDCTFAPSVADEYQSHGVGSLLMPALIDVARRMGKRSIVLMGGTQSTNERAVRFYQKFGFEYVGSYQTDIENYDMILYLT